MILFFRTRIYIIFSTILNTPVPTGSASAQRKRSIVGDNHSITDSGERQRQRVRLARLEADMAYFQARLELIGEATTSNRAAQRKVFNLLHKTVAGKILKVKRRYTDLN